MRCGCECSDACTCQCHPCNQRKLQSTMFLAIFLLHSSLNLSLCLPPGSKNHAGQIPSLYKMRETRSHDLRKLLHAATHRKIARSTATRASYLLDAIVLLACTHRRTYSSTPRAILNSFCSPSGSDGFFLRRAGPSPPCAAGHRPSPALPRDGRGTPARRRRRARAAGLPSGNGAIT